MRLGVVLLCASATLACPGRPARQQAKSPSPRPGTSWNLVLVTIDTLRADHMGTYGYRRNTSPRMDALGREGTVFERAYTYWPKTRASVVILMTGRRASQNGFSRRQPVLMGFNPTLASTLKEAGYSTAAIVDNANLAAQYGYAKGFDTYRETWEETELETETDRTRAITDGALRFFRARGPGPFFLWLHYVNPHAPYAPPPPYDTAFLDASASRGERLPVVKGYHGGIPERWAVRGQDRLGYYVAQYDGEIAAVDQEVGRVVDGIRSEGLWGHTLVVLTSDHGESLGEHGYYFDHGEDLFEPSLAIPLIIVAPVGKAGMRSGALASTLDLFPTILDALKVSYPPDLAGESLFPALQGGGGRERARLFAQNDLNLTASWDRLFKIVARPVGENEDKTEHSLYDRVADPGETRDVSRSQPEALRGQRRELELFRERLDREWARTRPLVEGAAQPSAKMSREACEKLKALGYIGADVVCQD